MTPAAATALGGLATGMADQSAVDPIYAAIECHRAAYAEFEAKCSRLDAAGTAEAKAEFKQLCAALEAAERELEIEPTTVRGVAAMLRYGADMQRGGFEIIDADTLADALEKIA